MLRSIRLAKQFVMRPCSPKSQACSLFTLSHESPVMLMQMSKKSSSISNIRLSSSSSSSQQNVGNSLARSNFHQDSEVALNRQINTEFTASYLYLAMAGYFDRDEVALPGFSIFFLNKSLEERDHGILCMRYMNKRGGKVRLENVHAPEKLEWKSGLQAMEEALDWEKKVNGIIIDMHQIASRNNDPQFTAFIENQFFNEQTDEIKQLANYVGLLRKVGAGLGEFEFDFEILQKNGQLQKFAAALGSKTPSTTS